MTIFIYRYRYRENSIDGFISIDGARVCDTTENHHNALPNGSYTITLQKVKSEGRLMPVITMKNPSTLIPQPYTFIKAGNGIYTLKNGCILVGEFRQPGVVIRSRPKFDLLFDRIKKSISRGHEVTLTIQDTKEQY